MNIVMGGAAHATNTGFALVVPLLPLLRAPSLVWLEVDVILYGFISNPAR